MKLNVQVSPNIILTATYKLNGKEMTYKKSYKSATLKNIESYLINLEQLSGQDLGNKREWVERIQARIWKIRTNRKKIVANPYSKFESLLSDALNKIAQEDGYFDNDLVKERR